MAFSRATVLLLCLLQDAAVSAGPKVDAVSPTVLPPGGTVRVQVTGQHLGPDATLHFLHEFRVHPLGSDGPAHAAHEFEVEVPEEAPLGMSVLRIVTAEGASALQLVRIDDLPLISVGRDAAASEPVRALDLPVMVEGRLPSLGIHRFQFRAEAGQVVSMEALGPSLGSSLDPLLRLTDAAGRELRFQDDPPGRGLEPALRHVFAEAGTYHLELRDATYRGGRDSRYLLRLGDYPLLTLGYPASVDGGSVEAVTLLGPMQGEERPLRRWVTPLPRGAGGRLLTVALEGSGLRASMPLQDSPYPLCREVEPNDALDQAQAVTLPVRVTGRLRPEADRDHYRVQIPAHRVGEPLEVRGRSRELGASCDLWLEWVAPDGRSVARMEGEQHHVLRHAFAGAGEYGLVVEELNRRGHRDAVYEVDLSWHVPGFELGSEITLVEVPAGGTARLKVTAERNGHEGAIELDAPGLGEGVTLDAPGIDARAKSSEVTFMAGPALAPGTVRHFRMRGRAEGDPAWQPVSTRPALAKRFPLLEPLPPGLDGWMTLVVVEGASSGDAP